MSRLQIPWLVRLLYNHNPFYLISAGLFVYGLKVMHRPFEAEYIEPWTLMGSFCGVTLLMVATAYGIVRFGRVWEDARSLVLVLLMMFLAISVSFDEIVTLVSWEDSSARSAIQVLGFGWCFSVAATELLLRGTGLKLPWVCRAPLYGLLALFFGFPLLVSPEVARITIEDARWRVAMFPTLAGCLTLGLIPAVRLGSAGYANNGSPWTWPLYPWSAFVFLGLAVCFRSYSLAISFDLASVRAHYWDTSFGLYFLVPFLLAVLIILLEIGLVERKPRLQQLALWTGPLLVMLARPWMSSKHWHFTRDLFLREFTMQVASPVFLTLCGLLLFYGYARLRGVRYASAGWNGTLLLAAFLPPHSLWLRLDEPQLVPVAILGVTELLTGIFRRSSLKTAAGSILLAVCAGLLAGDLHSPLTGLAVGWNLSMSAVLLAGLLISDANSRQLRQTAALMMAITAVATVMLPGRFLLHPGLVPVTIIGLAGTCAGLGVLRRELEFLSAATGILLCGLLRGSYELWLVLRQIQGAIQLLAGFVCFSLALFISILKSGLAGRLERCWFRNQPPLMPSSDGGSIRDSSGHSPE